MHTNTSAVVIGSNPEGAHFGATPGVLVVNYEAANHWPVRFLLVLSQLRQAPDSRPGGAYVEGLWGPLGYRT
jgi:hypothetical protein